MLLWQYKIEPMVNFEKTFTSVPLENDMDPVGNVFEKMLSEQCERPREAKKYLEEMFLAPRAAFGLSKLARSDAPILHTYLPELLDTIKQRHVPELEPGELREPVTRHKEGGVWKHTLSVMAAMERKEFIYAVKEVYGLDEEMSKEEVRAILFEKLGTEFAWVPPLHDIGKYGTQELRERKLENGKRDLYYSFQGHEDLSGELFDKIAQRLEFDDAEAAKIRQLLVDHMEMHKIARTGGISQEDKEEIFGKPNSEALLFIQLADTMGNYTDAQDAKQKVAAFLTAWREMKEYKAYVHNGLEQDLMMSA